MIRFSANSAAGGSFAAVGEQVEVVLERRSDGLQGGGEGGAVVAVGLVGGEHLAGRCDQSCGDLADAAGLVGVGAEVADEVRLMPTSA